jgi:site-specific DNA-methyltransferase (adenine-specific)
MKIDLRLGDCLEVLKTIPDNSIDSVVTDPPYHLTSIVKRFGKEDSAPAQFGTDGAYARASKGFMGKEWDGGDIAFRTDVWSECLRVLKPGGHLLAFSHSRTYHRMGVAIEDAGFEIRDQIMWIYGSGFPKSHNIGKAIQKQSGDVKVIGTKQGAGTTGKSYISNNEEYVDGDKGVFKKEYDDIEINNDWEGWGSAMKPSHEPIVMARKPLTEKSIAENVLKYGTGGINIDGCRINAGNDYSDRNSYTDRKTNSSTFQSGGQMKSDPNELGRFPANTIFDEEAGQLLDEQSSGASRFFYCPKAAKKDRNEGLEQFEDRPSQLNSGGIGRKISVEKRLEENGENAPTMKNNHPTVKPVLLMKYLINLITPPNGTTLDPFMGSGSTGKAAVRCGVNFIGIEKEQEYMDIASARIQHEQNKPLQTKLF